MCGAQADVRFGSIADILRCGSDVRFTPKADISLAYFFGAPEILTKALVRIENNIFAVLSL